MSASIFQVLSKLALKTVKGCHYLLTCNSLPLRSKCVVCWGVGELHPSVCASQCSSQHPPVLLSWLQRQLCKAIDAGLSVMHCLPWKNIFTDCHLPCKTTFSIYQIEKLNTQYLPGVRLSCWNWRLSVFRNSSKSSRKCMNWTFS